MENVLYPMDSRCIRIFFKGCFDSSHVQAIVIDDDTRLNRQHMIKKPRTWHFLRLKVKTALLLIRAKTVKERLNSVKKVASIESAALFTQLNGRGKQMRHFLIGNFFD